MVVTDSVLSSFSRGSRVIMNNCSAARMSSHQGLCPALATSMQRLVRFYLKSRESDICLYVMQRFWQNVSTTVGCAGGHLDCMREVNFTTLNTAAKAIKGNYSYQFQPRVDGDFVADTCTSLVSLSVYVGSCLTV